MSRLRPIVALLLLAATAVAAAAWRERAVEAEPRQVSSGQVTGSLGIVDSDTAYRVVPAGSPTELSGITWAGGNRFYAVSDNDAAVHPFEIDLDAASGRVRGIGRLPPLRLHRADGRASQSRDLEGVAFDAVAGEITVVDEGALSDPQRSIVTYRLADGRQRDALDLRGTFFSADRVRRGLGLESLARQGESVWTANEEALLGDGDRSSRDAGTLVRLTRFDRGKLAGQWAYRTEPAGGVLPFLDIQVGGVVELAVLPDGRLLVLERASLASRSAEDPGGFVSRIHLVDTRTGTNVLGIPSLDARGEVPAFRPVRKELLWSRQFPLTEGPMNFEGMALGPRLADGSRSLILISDNGFLPSTLWALRLYGATEP